MSQSTDLDSLACVYLTDFFVCLPLFPSHRFLSLSFAEDNLQEKWELGRDILAVILRFIQAYVPQPDDFKFVGTDGTSLIAPTPAAPGSLSTSFLPGGLRMKKKILFASGTLLTSSCI